ncbi:MAG: hypothetical protein QXR60_03630, partial [Candidatus Nanoarchaeia archaeon]
MKRELIAFFCIGLLITMPLVFAAETKTNVDIKEAAPTFKSVMSEEYDEREAGEAIVVQVKSYEPQVLVASAIEQDDVPVFVFLAGSSLGSLTGPEFLTEGRLTVVQQGDIFYGVPPIKNVYIRERDFDSRYIRSVTYKPPKNRMYSMDNLGYLIVNLKQIPREADVPDVIDANITARIEFDMERSYGIGRQTLVLGEEADEKAFLKKDNLRENMVFSGNAYVRAVKISDDSVDLMVYDTALKSLGSKTNVKVGQISSAITLRGTHSNLIQDQFRIQVDSIVDPQREYAEVEVSIDGSMPEKKIVYKGQSLYPGSSLTVSDLSKIVSGTETIESVKIKGSTGVVTAVRNYTDKYNIMAAELKKEVFDKNSNTIIDSWGKLKNIVKTENYDFGKLLTDYFVKFDFSAVEGDKDFPPVKLNDKVKTLSKLIYDLKLTPEVTLTEENDKKVFVVKFFKQKEKQVVDVCSPSDLLFSPNSYYDSSVKNKFEEFFRDDKTLSNYEKKRLLCSAIDVFKKISASYPDEVDPNNKIRYSVQADYMIAKCYDELAKLGAALVNADVAKSNALSFYRRVKSAGLQDDFINERIDKLSQSQVSGEEFSDVSIDDNGRQVDIHLVRVVDKKGAQLDASARISINNRPPTVFRTGDSLFPGEGYDMDKCRIKEILSTSVVIENCPKHDKDRKTIGTMPDITIKENVQNTIENYKVLLLGTELHKQVQITVLPGSGKSMFSESSFMLHIPVEKRAIKLNSDKIDEKINKTEQTIKKLTSIITDLDSIIKSWKAVCLVTFAFLTIKNSFGIFGGGAARVRARERVMVDGGWRKYCEMDSGPGKTYKSYDECIFEHSDKINKNIDAVEKAFEVADKTYKKGATNVAGTDVTDLRELQKMTGEQVYSEENFKSLVYLQALSDACKGVGDFGTDEKGKPLPNACTDVSTKYQSELFRIQKLNEESKNGIASIKNEGLDSYTAWKAKNPLGTLQQFRNKQVEAYNQVISVAEFNAYVGSAAKNYFDTKKPVAGQVMIIKDKQGNEAYYWETAYGTVPVEKGTEKDTYVYKTKEGDLMIKSAQKPDKIITVATIKWDADKRTGQAVLPNGVSYPIHSGPKGEALFDDSTPFAGYSAFTHREAVMGDVAGLRQTYDPGATYECYEDNTPYCIPLSRGNFVKVLEFYKDGSPKTMNIWNVGADGRLCTSDDVPAVGDSKYGNCAHTSSLMTNKDCSRILAEVQAKVNAAARYCKSKSNMKSDDGHTFKHSITAAAQESYSKAGHCEDAMEIEDCKLMFAVCDPVMCPPSRFNLAGNWQVSDVTRTGIIGSIVLGLHNFPTDPVPVCLTGVSAGLKNIRSIFEAYKECLITMKVEGRSVGICDKIRSVYLCQILWQEAIAIFKVKGGLLDVVGKMFGNAEGGGEYLSMSDNFANVEKSVNYFTQSYASSVFAAHKGKSLEEVGTEICKSAVYGKIPGLGEYFDHLTEPENPPQFTALFEEMPYSATEKKSQYSVYYHIYAGTDQEVQYSVYLKNPSGRKYYVTEACERRNKKIPMGEFADFSITCVTDTGYTSICVEINGKEECGFGKVSTAF